MFTKFEQIEDWVRDFGLIRWEVSTKPSFEGDTICRSDWFEGDNMEDKLDKCRKYVEDCQRKLYIRGTKTTSPNSPWIVNEIQINNQEQHPAMPMGYAPAPAAIDEDKLTEKIRKELQLDYDRKELERREKELAEEMREYRHDKESAIGMLVGYLHPLLGKGLAAVSGAQRPAAIHGVDAPADVEAERIQDPAQGSEAPDPEDAFTDEESDKLYSLMARFKKVEPDYLAMLERVVVMAESGDAAYSMAKSFLVK